MLIAQYHPRALVGDGGITNSVHRLSAAFVRCGAQARVICDDAEAAVPDIGVEWARLRHVGGGSLRAPIGVADALEGVDLLVCNSAWTAHNVVAARAAERVGVPYVLAPRGAYDPRIRARHRWRKDLWWLAAERRLVERCRAVHVFFPEERVHLKALGHTGDLIVAPNGVRVPDGPAWDGGTGGYLLYLGRFDPEHKGLDLLLRAMAIADRGAIPPLRLHGPDWRGGKDRTHRLVEELRLADRVVIGEAVYGEEKSALLRAAAGFVYPSRWEGFGNSPAEAAALGVPTLVTPYPLGRYLAERGAAVLVEATAQGIAEGLPALVAPEAATIGATAARVTREALSWDAVAAAWLQQASRLVQAMSADVGMMSGPDAPRDEKEEPV